MALWNSLVAQLTHLLILLSTAYGGNLGLAIVTLSLTVRVAMFPWTLRLMRKAEVQRARMEQLKPELDRLRLRFSSDPTRLSQEVFALYRRSGVNPLDPRTFLTALAQLPIMAALSATIREGLKVGGRFLWVADLARPDALLTLLVAALAGLAAILHPSASKDVRPISAAIPALLTVLFMWKLSAGLGLYWAVSSGVGIAQSLTLRSRKSRE
jgi:YidC/Oxa1 family membrane protein insertase